MNVVEASGLGKRYGRPGRCATARWRYRGRVTALVGPNGAGKTTC